MHGFFGNPWESVGNGISVPRKGVCGRVRVGKWALVMKSCLHARWMQMAESRRRCTPAQQSKCNSNSLAFTSRFSAVAVNLLVSRHTPWHKRLVLVPKFYSRRIPRYYRENHRNSCKKSGIPANPFSTREGRSAEAFLEAERPALRKTRIITIPASNTSIQIHPLCSRSIAGVPSSKALPGYIITAHHLCVFPTYLAR